MGILNPMGEKDLMAKLKGPLQRRLISVYSGVPNHV
jgi:hypothetical protein